MSPEPVLRLGAASPGGLALPAAAPTASQMYAPRGVWTDGTRIVLCDTGNHRVLIWHAWPDHDGAAADVVLGQPDFESEGSAAGGRGPERGLYLPSGVGVVDGHLVVCDGWHHRILAWDGLPESSDAAPAFVLGQPDLSHVAANRGGDPGPDSFYWPFGFGVVAGTFWVTDSGNRRVLGWHTAGGLPEPDRPADVLLGQDGPAGREDNRGGAVGAATFRWPHAVTGDDGTMWVADAGDHRVLGWTLPPAAGSGGDRPADLVLGQAGFEQAEEFKNRPQGAGRLRFPYAAVLLDGDRLAVADTSNNRILLWDKAPRVGAGLPADHVLGQPDMDANGENRWDAVADDSLCWPYGLSAAGSLLAVADSGNNRATVWQLD